MGSRRPHTAGAPVGQALPLEKLSSPRASNRSRRIHPKIIEVPTEVVNAIIDEAFLLAPHDLRALLFYALVSKQWLQYSRYLYFLHRRYEFKAGYQYPEWREENDELIRLLRGRCSTLRGTMLNMAVKGSDETCGRSITSCGNSEDYMYLNRLLTYQISSFANLQSLTLKCMHWVMLKPDSVTSLMELRHLTSLSLEKVMFKDLEHLFETLLHHFSSLEELKLFEINFMYKPHPRSASDEPPLKLSSFPRLRRLEVDMDPRLLPLLDTRCLPSACEYLGFRGITTVAHLLKIKALVQHAGSDLRHLKLDIEEPIPYLLVDFTRNDKLRHLEVSYCIPDEHPPAAWSLGWLTEAVNTIVSPSFDKLDLTLWYLPLAAGAVPHLELPSLQDALLRKMVAAGGWDSRVRLTFLQTRRVVVSDFDVFIIGVRKHLRILDKQRRLKVLIDY